MSKLKSFKKLVVRPRDHTKQEYEEYCNLLDKAGVLWHMGQKPIEYNFPPKLDNALILDTRAMTLRRSALGNSDYDRYTVTIPYAIFLLEDHLYEQA